MKGLGASFDELHFPKEKKINMRRDTADIFIRMKIKLFLLFYQNNI